MADAFYPDGSPIPENKLSEAISQGQARWRKGEQVSFSTPTGERYDVPAESAWDAIGRGWAPETAGEQRLRDYKARAGTSETLQAFGESALSTATLGISDVFLGDEESELARKASPFATTLGEVAGLVTPMGVEAALARGGARGAVGLAARGATAPVRTVSRFARGAGEAVTGLLPEATSVTGRAFRAATRYGVEGAIEGAAFGAGRELSRQSLGDEQLSIEKILSAGGEGALFGGAVGAGVGGIGRVLGDTFVKAAQTGRGATRFAETKALTAAGALGGDLNKITSKYGPERANRIGRELLDRELITPLDSLAQRSTKIGAAKEEVGGKIGELYKRLDDSGAAVDTEALGSRIAQYLGELRSKGVGPDIRLASRIERDWLPSFVGKPAKAPSAAAEAGAIPTWREFSKQRMGPAMKEALAATPGAKMKDVHGPVMKQLGADFRALKAAGPTEAIVPTAGGIAALPATKTFQELHGGIKRLQDEIFDKATGTVRAKHLEKLRAVVKNELREQVRRFSPEEATALQRLDEGFADLTTIDRISRKRVGQAAGNRSISLTDTMAGLTGLAVGGPGGLALAVANKALRSERTDAALAVALDKLRRHSDKSALTVSQAVQKSARKAPQRLTFELPTRAANVAKEYAERSEAPRQFATNPSAASARLERVVAPLSEADPVLARRAASTLADDLAWLSKRVPRGTTAGLLATLTGRDRAPSVPQSAAASYTRTAKALADPVGAIKDMERGILAPETLDVLRERRPALRQAMTREIVSAAVTLAKRGEQPGYTWRIQSSLVTGAPLDATMEPSFIRMAQAMWDAQSAPKQATAPPPSRETSKRMRDRVRQHRTATEEIEGGE